MEAKEKQNKDEFVVEPASAWPERYDQKGYRISPDIARFMDSDGTWYHANGIRDEIRSPKKI